MAEGALQEVGGMPGQEDGNIYMDYNGSTPVDPAVRDAMVDSMTYVLACSLSDETQANLTIYSLRLLQKLLGKCKQFPCLWLAGKGCS